ncbi:PQQ-dependent sugar dehydrogenase [Streptomyces sp. NPDC091292]|uniref:PQQ-dependent sugar dehydrogenase n=1 Tax=Streptomyces sp. NPDC091292 TaxID=3365991 RepID=UPI0038132250
MIVQRRAVTAVLTAAALLFVAGCSSGGDGPGGGSSAPGTSKPGSADPTGSASASATPPPAKGSVDVVRTVGEGLNSPWGLAPLPGGDLLVSSRDTGTITRIDAKNGKKTEAGKVPGVAAAGEGGLLGLALSPSFASDHMVYAYFTTESDNRIARMLYDEKKPTGQQLGAPNTVLRGIPKGAIHNGGRIAFGPDKMLYAGTGETGDTGLAQDKESLGGKILRMTPDGEPAPGNPFGATSYVYSYGHRNVEGLAWDEDKRLWASEFGQDKWDELNQIVPGDNYGWPTYEGTANKPGYHDPVVEWHPSEASPAGIAYAEGSIWMAALRGQRLWRIPVRGVEGKPKPEAFLDAKYGRLRTVVSEGGDKLWLTTSNTDGRGTPKAGDDRVLEVRVS